MNGHLRTPTDNTAYLLLREGRISEFNTLKAENKIADLTNLDLRGTTLCGLDANGLDLSGCYFRQADLRGIDFSRTNLRGASFNGSKISGALFPTEISAAELELSLAHGTRIRYNL